MSKEEAVKAVIDLLEANGLEELSAKGISAEVANAHIIINREQTYNMVSEFYDVFANAGLLK